MKRASFFNMSDAQFNRIVAVLLALMTAFAALIAYLQGDASIRDDRANRDSKRYSIEAFGNQVSGDARVNYDYNVAYQAVYELELLANSASNRGDDAAAARYQALAEEARQLSPMLGDQYYDVENGTADVARYEADTYLVQITTLSEQFKAASDVKDGWDAKANTYIIHLTLLGVVLFMLGLSTTLSGGNVRWIFVGTGLVIALITMVWAFINWSKPVFDLRTQGDAIPAYAAGVGLAHQDKNEEAITAFDIALQAYPKYAAAWAERANANLALGDLDAAISDFEQARASGDKTAYVAGDLAWAYYQQGRYEDAVKMNQIALAASPDELWIQFDLALSLLAQGDSAGAQAAYQKGMDQAAEQVAAAQSSGQAPPSYLWSSLLDGADSLDGLIDTLENNDGLPPVETITDPEATLTAAYDWMAQLKNLALALEYTGQKPSADAPTAVISPLAFTTILDVDEQGEAIYSEPMTEFEPGTDEIVVNFDYSNLQPGQVVAFKLYVNGEEDPSWRMVDPWELDADGSAVIELSYAYSDTFVFDPGLYTVEIYVDYHLMQRDFFYVNE